MATLYFGNFSNKIDKKTGLRKLKPEAKETGVWRRFRRFENDMDRVDAYLQAENEGRAIPRDELKKLKGDTPVFTRDKNGKITGFNPANLDEDSITFNLRKFRQNNADRAEQLRTGIRGAKAPRPSITINGRSFDSVGAASAFARANAREIAANNRVRREAIAAAKAFGLDKKGGVFDNFDVTNGEALTDDQRSVISEAFRSWVANTRQVAFNQKQGNFSTFKAEQERIAEEAGGSPPRDTPPGTNATQTYPLSYQDREALERQRVSYAISAQGRRDASAARLRDLFLRKEDAENRKLIADTKKVFSSAAILGINLRELPEE